MKYNSGGSVNPGALPKAQVRFHLPAEQRKRKAWGEPTSDSEVGVTPGKRPAEIRSPRRFGGVAAKAPRGNRLGYRDSWGCGMLAETSNPDPGSTLPLLRSCRRVVTNDNVDAYNHWLKRKATLGLLPKPDALPVLATSTAPGQVLAYGVNLRSLQGVR